MRLVRFIKRSQELGFSMRDIQELIDLRPNRSKSRTQVRALAAAKVTDIAARVRRLNAMSRALEELVTACSCDGASRECPIIEALDGELPDEFADCLATGGRPVVTTADAG